MVCAALADIHPDLEIETVVIKTSGDWHPSDGEVRLEESAGGKGQFAKEIEQALLDNSIDAAVHSMKDMESFMPEGLTIDHMLPREDPRDAFLSNDIQNIEGLPQGATVGTASVRRQAFLLSLRPDLNVVPFRGNVGTRIEKLRTGQVDATLLALAGLKRLGLEHEAASIIDPDVMLPAAGQGAVGIETRVGDTDIQSIFDPISHKETVLCVGAERAALAILDGSCHTPIGAQATLDGDQMHLRLAVVSLDGQQKYSEEGRAETGNLSGAEALGRNIGQRLKDQLPEGFLS